MKIDLDKYYTPKTVANFCVEQAVSVIGRDNITEVIEPSIGDGAFVTDILPIDLGIDLDPQLDTKTIPILKKVAAQSPML